MTSSRQHHGTERRRELCLHAACLVACLAFVPSLLQAQEVPGNSPPRVTPIQPPAQAPPPAQTLEPAVLSPTLVPQAGSIPLTTATGQVVGGQAPVDAVPSAAQSPQATAPQTAAGQPAATGQSPPAPLAAETNPAAVPPSEAATLRENASLRLEQLKGETETRPEVREQLTKLYQQIQADAAVAEQATQQTASWQGRVEAAPTALDEARNRKKNAGAASAEAALQDLDFVSYEEGQQKLRDLEAQLATIAAERSKLAEAATFREQRRKELPQLISDARARLEQLATRPPPDGGNETPAIAEARGWANLAARLALEKQITALENEQRAIEAEAQLLPLRLELAQVAEKELQERVRRVNDELNRIRQNRILTQRSDLYELMKLVPDGAKPIGEQLLERIDQWQALAERQAVTKQELQTAVSELTSWKDQFSRIDARVNPASGTRDNSEFNSWVGLMLRKQRGELPDASQLQARIRAYRDEMQKTDLLLFDVEDSLTDLRAQLAASRQAEADRDELFLAPAGAGEPSTPEEAASLLLARGEEILEGMKLDADDYLDDLYEIADVKYQTRLLTQRYRNLIDEHILWIRSCEPIAQADFSSAIEAFRWLVSYQNWQGVGLGLLADLRQQPWWWVAFLGGLSLLIARQSGWRRLIGQSGAQAERKTCIEFWNTGRALLLTFLISTPVLFIMLFFAWRIYSAGEEFVSVDAVAQFSSSLANGLLLGSAVFAPLELLRQVCRLEGLGIKHFEWDQAATRSLGTNLRWLIDLSVPLSVMIGMLASQSVPRWETSLGRLAFILLMPLLAVFLARVFHPSQGAISFYLREYPDGWLDRLSYVWYSALILFPLAMLVASAVGYHYTATRFATHFNNTAIATIALLLVYFVAQRWLVLNRRKIMLTKARQRLEEAAKRDASNSSTPPVAEAANEIDLTAVNDQTRRLLTSAIVAAGLVLLYFIWSDIIPAIGFLNNVKLWKVEGATPDETVDITLSNLLLVIPLAILLYIAARNIPGLLEIVFLQHLPLTTAARYATTTITRYVIIGIGLVIVLSTLGLRWSSIQWLVAALGVGLGFGLQEIFANFVSGVILLFEQPIRVGDIITIDGTTGTVQRIRMRATTITNWDRQELVIPNKDLITGKLLNWTLTDSTNRIVINVGVAYGSDTRQACALIREICDQHPNLMSDPAPLITFEGFGDNSLTIVLRGYLSSLDKRLTTIHELHQEIYSRFNAAGIEIAFPQRDLHLRSLPGPLLNWLERSSSTNRSEEDGVAAR